MSRPVFATIFVVVTLCVGSAAWAQEKDSAVEANRQYRVALGFQQKGLFPQAEKRWATFIESFPQHERLAHAYLHLGVCQFKQEKFAESVKTFDKILNDFANFEHGDTARFNKGLSRYNLALKSNNADDFQTAADTFAKLAETFPNSALKPEALYYQAESLYAAGRLEAAVAVYAKSAEAADPKSLKPTVWYALGTAQQEMKKPADAEQTFRRFLKEFPEHSLAKECKLRLGMTLTSQEKFNEAVQIFTELAAVKEFPHADFALLQHADLLREQEKLAEAAAKYESLPKSFQESPYIGLALLQAGQCRYRLSEFEKAQANLAIVVEQKSEQSPQSAYWLGLTLLRLEKPVEAEKVFATAATDYAESPFGSQLALSRIDAIYAQTERRGEAIPLYAEFAKNHAGDPLAAEAQYLAAFSAVNVADYADAKRQASVFLQNDAWSGHKRTPDVLFLAGESELLSEPSQPEKAEPHYRQLIKDFPQHADVPRSHVRIGYCLYKTDQFDAAMAYLNSQSKAFADPELKAEAKLIQGRCHRAKNQWPQAVAALRSAYQTQPDWAYADEVLFELGNSLRESGQIDAALTELNRLIDNLKESPLVPRAKLTLGDIELERERYDEAIAKYRSVIFEHEKSAEAPDAWFGLSLALFRKSDYEGVVKESSALLEKHPNATVNASARQLRGLAHQELAHFENAIVDFRAYLSTHPGDDDSVSATLAVAVCQMKLDKPEDAIATLKALLTEYPKHSRLDEVYHELGYAYLTINKEKEAAETFRTLATKFVKSAYAGESWFRVGEFHENAEQPNEAEKAYNQGLSLAKKPELRERLLFKLGWIRHEQEQYAEAVSAFEQQRKEFPRGELSADATFLAGECHYRLKQFAKAAPHYEELIAAKSPKYQARSLYRIGDCAGALDQWSKSEGHYRGLIEAFPKFAQINEARYGLGLALQKQKKLDEAIDLYERVTQLTDSETAARSRFMIGECRFAQKEYDKAVEHFLEAALGYPYDEWKVMGHLEAGRCFIELGDLDKARDALQTVIDKYPDHPRTKDAKTILANLETNR